MYIKYSLYEPVTFKSRENEIGHTVEQVTKKSCKTAKLEERSAAIEKGVKAVTKAASISPAHMTWVGKNGEKGITCQLVMLQSLV